MKVTMPRVRSMAIQIKTVKLIFSFYTNKKDAPFDLKCIFFNTYIYFLKANPSEKALPTISPTTRYVWFAGS